MAKIVILGAGSIGCWIGGHLIAGGAQVTLIGREKYAAQIAEHGLTLTHFDRSPLRCESMDFKTEGEALAGADIIALCVKVRIRSTRLSKLRPMLQKLMS